MSSIIDPSELTPLSDEVRTGVVRMDAANKAHQRALLQTVYGEALVHGEELFDKAAFDKVIKAAEDNKIRAYFLIVSMELCKPKFAGAAIQIPTAILKQRGSHIVAVPGEHGEDTALCQSLSEIVRELTTTEANPGGVRLGTWFTQERIRLSMIDPACMPYGMISGGRTAEHWIDNVPVTKLYKKFNTTLGTRDTPILHLNGLTPEIEDRAIRMRMPVEKENLGHSNIFLMRWTDGDAEVALSFTESISTFQGHPVVRVNAKSNGKPLNDEVLKDVLAALFHAGGKVISKRQWGAGNIYSIFGGRIPVMLIHAPSEQQIVNALRDMGAQERRLGGCLMVPSLMDFENLPQSMIGSMAVPVRPFTVFDTSNQGSGPYFNLAA